MSRSLEASSRKCPLLPFLRLRHSRLLTLIGRSCRTQLFSASDARKSWKSDPKGQFPALKHISLPSRQKYCQSLSGVIVIVNPYFSQ